MAKKKISVEYRVRMQKVIKGVIGTAEIAFDQDGVWIGEILQED